MLGGDRGPDAHRDWWSAVVGSAAYRAALPVARADVEPAPLAALVQALGPASPPPPRAGGPAPARSVRGWMLAALFLALLAELASRRLRGAP
jgi:hypothetical protein